MSTEPEDSEESEEIVRKPESELGLDLDLHFLPAWAQKSAPNKYEKFTGEESSGDRGRDRRGGRGFDRGGGDRGPRRSGPPGGGGGRPGGFGGRQGDRGARGRGQDQRGQRPPPRREEIKLPELEVNFLPEEKGVESLARQIKLSGRAYPLFEIAFLVLKKPERYHVQLASIKKPEGQPAQMIYVCGLDDTLWLDENEALQHVLDKHFSTFYSTEKIPTDPPKGTYTFVAQCGISGTILGPPNYHDYQNKLRKLHQERFARMNFDAFKSRIKIVKDEAVVKKWLEEQSFRTEYTCLNIPETIKLNSREEVENHFRQTHLPNVVKAVESHTMPGTAIAGIQNRGLQSLLRRAFDEQMRFPLKVVNHLSGQFSRQGLQFFKVNKTVTHVSVARPKYLDMEATPVSEGVKRIVEYIDTHPKTTRKKLLEALAPGSSAAASPAEAPAAEAPPAPATAEEGTPAAPVEAAPAAPAAPAQSPEMAALVGDLHWLVHQGHVIEFANGILDTAKKPLPRPARPQPQKKEGQAAAEGEAAPEPAKEGAEAAPEASAEVEQAEAIATETAPVQDESGVSAGADVTGTNQTEQSPSEENKDQQNPGA